MDKLLTLARLACRITTTAFDEELRLLIGAARGELRDCGVSMAVLDYDTMDDRVQTAILTYVKANFGTPDVNDRDRLTAAWIGQKASLADTTGYTEWGEGIG